MVDIIKIWGKYVFLAIIVFLIGLSIRLIVAYGSHTQYVQINRLPSNNSRLEKISQGYRNKIDATPIMKDQEVYQNFLHSTMEEKRILIASHLGFSANGLKKTTVGDYFTAKRLEITILDMKLNGTSASASGLDRLAKATGIDKEELEEKILFAYKMHSIDNYYKIYPNLASVEWEIFIQSQELNQILQDFPD
ncbi:hypothetical protein PVA44_05580 [Entomospira nematocerorum]|uniref:Uncharacterized protein n=1 Tax=Entomospira nematocerorum TaxID=2719987 RepID=A0A968GDX4_9SPIO|nr:hypothetical protein [Entomospira nematocera]NIZ46510.1 hypothetical protein [Entomospira nematocera]WDI33689.1 hypothetical protein PVA44_05580 [Entomospira nematocera]